VWVRSLSDDLEVQVRQAPYGSSRTVATNIAVAMRVAGDRVGVYARTPDLYINGTATSVNGHLALTGGGAVDGAPGRYRVSWPDGTYLDVGRVGGYVDINMLIATNRSGAIVGLLGNSDGSAANDLVSKAGIPLSAQPSRNELYGQYAESWRIAQAESLFDYVQGEATETYTDRTFPDTFATGTQLDPSTRQQAETTCANAGVTDPILLAGCVLDVGTTGDETFANFPATTAVPPEVAVSIPTTFVPFQASGYRYKVVPSGTGQGFESTTFDDSEFATGSAYFGTGCGMPLVTPWPLNTDILVRKMVDLPQGASGLKVTVAVDNDTQVFLNGSDVSCGLNFGGSCSPYSVAFVFAVPDNILVPGENLLAVRGHDYGVADFLDVQVTGFSLP
jgi:hypothetical protein